MRRQAQSRRACAALLTGAAAFLALEAGLAAVVEVGPTALRDPNYAARLSRLRVRVNAAPARPLTVVMLGSSRTMFDLQAGTLDRPLGRELGRPVVVGNFGLTGGGPVSQLLTWRRLRRDGVRPDLVLIEVHPAFLTGSFPYDELTEERLPLESLNLSDERFLRRWRVRSRPGRRREEGLILANPWYSRRGALVQAAAPGLAPPAASEGDAGGFLYLEKAAFSPSPDEGRPPDEVREKALEGARRQYEPPLADFRLGGRGCQALRELLASCRAAGVPAALVALPEGPAFRSWYAPGAWPEVSEWLRQQGEEFGAPFVSVREWSGEDDFFDSHHLLAPGAAKFTRRFGREVILPRLRRLAGREGAP
jgi:hypothetical protein